MKKYTFLLSLLLLAACKKQTEFPVPDCVQGAIKKPNKPSKITQWEYEKKDYYLIVYGTLDNGSGQLIDNQCDTICTVTDDFTCSNLSDFWENSKLIKVIFE
jgi:hypothetical protein